MLVARPGLLSLVVLVLGACATSSPPLAPTHDETMTPLPVAADGDDGIAPWTLDASSAEGEYTYEEGPYEEGPDEVDWEHPEPESRSVGRTILFWFPNRIFDLLDIVRARVRVGPGWTMSARATEFLDLNMGAHKSIFVGLHGPREEPIIPWPIGLEVFKGVEVSLLDDTDETERRGPRYGPLEVGLGFQFLIIGVDVGVEAFEAFDFLSGLILFDPGNDDL